MNETIAFCSFFFFLDTSKTLLCIPRIQYVGNVFMMPKSINNAYIQYGIGQIVEKKKRKNKKVHTSIMKKVGFENCGHAYTFTRLHKTNHKEI